MEFSRHSNSLTIDAFLGRNIGFAGLVSEEELSLFLRDVVATKFQSFTRQDIIGYWEGMEERSVKLTFIVAEEEGHEAIVKARQIAHAYCLLFRQEAVAINTHTSDFFLEGV